MNHLDHLDAEQGKHADTAVTGPQPETLVTGTRELCSHGVSVFDMCWPCCRYPLDNKFNQGSGVDGKHYWLTPPELMMTLDAEFGFDFDPCPYPKPENFDGLTCEWGKSTYVNPPFGSTIHNGKKVGPTAWAKKALAEHSKGKRVVLVYPIDKWILMLLAAGAQVRNLGDVKWCAAEDGEQGKGTGRHVACFVLEPPSQEQSR